MKLQLLTVGFLLFTPFSSQSETIDLTCTDATGFWVYFDIDTSRGMVFSSGYPAKSVAITKNSIKFTLVFDGR